MAGISPMRVGDTYPDAVWTFKNDNGGINPLPSGTTLTLVIYNPKTNTVQNGAGTWDTSALAVGQATYSWSSSDTAVAGNFKCYAKFTTPLGKTGTTDLQDFIVQTVFVQQ
jgi:hypothetical protein